MSWGSSSGIKPSFDALRLIFRPMKRESNRVAQRPSHLGGPLPYPRKLVSIVVYYRVGSKRKSFPLIRDAKGRHWVEVHPGDVKTPEGTAREERSCNEGS